MKETNGWVDPFETMPQESWYPGNVAKTDRVIQSTAAKYASMKVVKQPEHERASTTE